MNCTAWQMYISWCLHFRSQCKEINVKYSIPWVFRPAYIPWLSKGILKNSQDVCHFVLLLTRYISSSWVWRRVEASNNDGCKWTWDSTTFHTSPRKRDQTESSASTRKKNKRQTFPFLSTLFEYLLDFFSKLKIKHLCSLAPKGLLHFSVPKSQK